MKLEFIKFYKFILPVIALFSGLSIGGYVNMLIIKFGGIILPIGDGVDSSNLEHLKEIMPTLEIQYFITPFLAHAIGTLIGAMIALWFSNRSVVLAYVVGVFFLIGGSTMVYILPESPLWFDVFDLTLAYIPMAWVATKIIKK